ncbi:tigger transposable element-derived protein 1-like, partial [Homarus americanus]|uniref:tigger transposable element-derived protein 1-like n=1 Tax=Homarus americanus TaxID=6706 RepID=UPI001C4726AB
MAQFMNQIAGHNRQNNYVCVQCGELFYSNDSLKMHTCMAEHTDEKDIKCEEFDESFNSDYDVTQHVTVDEKDIKCEEFDESFNSDYDVTQQVFEDLKAKAPSGSDSAVSVFKDTKGWFTGFRKRNKLHSVVRHGEAASVDKDAAREHHDIFLKVIQEGGFVSQQVFNCDETGLFWKKMPRRTYITREDTSFPGHKPMKDRLTLLFCANASGDCKVKPLLVYHAENPRALKNIRKNRLGVMWRSNPKAWVTRKLFSEWVIEVFGPTVRDYLRENNLPLKALLRDFEGFEELEEEAVVQEIVCLGNSMGLEMDEEDVEELVEEHRKELSIEELLELHTEK